MPSNTTYFRTPKGIRLYPTFDDFPDKAENGDFALAIATTAFYYYNSSTQLWVPIGGGGGAVNSVTGLNTDNSDPANPVIQISVDGVTITGSGTPGSPLTAIGSGSVDSVSGTAPNVSITGTAADPIVNAGQNSWEFPNFVTTALISGDQDNYTQAGLDDAVVLRVDSDVSPAVFTGFDGGTNGRILIVQNISANPIYFSNENGGSLAANRIIFTKNTQEVAANGISILQYDSTVSRWRLQDSLSSVVVDGVTVTGDGTSQAPLTAIGGSGISLGLAVMVTLGVTY